MEINSNMAERLQSIPQTPALPHCDALNQDGSECKRMPGRPDSDFCHGHHREKNRLYAKYKKKEAEFEARSLGDHQSVEIMEEIVHFGDEAVALRNEVNHRFFSRGTGNNRGHIQQILRIQNQVDGLKGQIASLRDQTKNTKEPTSKGTADGAGDQVKMYQSLISPDVPLSELAHLPSDHPVVNLRKTVDSIRNSQIDRIYNIFACLNDTTDLISNAESGTQRAPNTGDIVIRYVFRAYLLWKGSAEVLSRANKYETINTFLRHSTTELEDYIKFLQAFKSGRGDTSHLLRDAICDFLLPEARPSITILGRRVASEPSQRRMDVHGWDILYRHFSHMDTWNYLEQYSTTYDDLLLVKKLSALNRYGSPGDDTPSWLHPDDDISQECRIALLLGFVAQTKGFCDPKEPFSHGADGSITQRQTRNYVAGRMSKTDPLAQKLAYELCSRALRYILLVYDGETGKPAFNTAINNEWICRTRTASHKKDLVTAKWEVSWSMTSILNDLSVLRSIRDRMMGRNYYEFVIIDKEDSLTFDVLESVASVLVHLSGNLSAQGIVDRTVREIIPPAEK